MSEKLEITKSDFEFIARFYNIQKMLKNLEKFRYVEIEEENERFFQIVKMHFNREPSYKTTNGKLYITI